MQSFSRLAQVLSDHKAPQRAAQAARLVLLCTESFFGISILVAAPVAAVIDQSDCKPNYWLHCFTFF